MKHQGFTFVESIIVIFILSLIVAMSFTIVPAIRVKQEQRYFFKNFEAQYMRYLNETMLTHRAAWIRVDPHQVVFIIETRPKQAIPLPKSITKVKISSKDRLIAMSDEGITAPRTLSFTTESGQIYTYKIQIGWGILHVQKT
ncbi:type II secretion system protein [Lactobacillus sp. CC-MHH1034]|uniref:type II secretion system protein n=1 Tax=Agrilactobacillus fermenti TaxID=2586909 RepID=UPI001E5BA339|nr:type II secretion system protein [Agrilactobacillus fermenti]MCD2256312.1 type II secretion system protein [Agrilactobacillus fermenti]